MALFIGRRNKVGIPELLNLFCTLLQQYTQVWFKRTKSFIFLTIKSTSKKSYIPKAKNKGNLNSSKYSTVSQKSSPWISV